MFAKQIALTFVVLTLFSYATAQEPSAEQFLYLDDWSYELIDYWINSGALIFPHILNQPYSVSIIRDRLPAGSRWSDFLSNYYNRAYGKPGFGSLLIYARDNLAIVSEKSPGRRALTAASARELLFFENKTRNHFNFAPQLNIMLPHATFANRTMINSEYRVDPLYAGDNSEYLYGRVNDAFLNLNTGPMGLFVGRIHRNWGAPGSPGLILSDNAYTFDHVQFSYTTQRLKFSMLVSRLEDVHALFDEVPGSLLDSRRFMTAHRFDFNVSRKFQFALTEIVMYGGPGRDFEFAFLNPLNLYYLSQRNQTLHVNGIWSLDLLYKPHTQVNLFLQLLIDDFIINNGPEKNDRSKSPDRLGIHLRVSTADLFLKGLQAGLEYTRIGNRTYQSRRTWENFHFREKSLGYPTSSIEKFSGFAKYFGFYRLLLSARASYSRTGDIRLTDLYPLETKESFPVPVVEKNMTLKFSGSYFQSQWLKFSAMLQYERLRNYNHVEGENKSLVKASLGLHVYLRTGLNISK